MKKLLSIILAILMIVTVVPMAFAEGEITCFKEHFEGTKCDACAQNRDIIELVDDKGNKASFKHLYDLNNYIKANAPINATVTLLDMVYCYGYIYYTDTGYAYTEDFLYVISDEEVNLTLDLNGYGIESEGTEGELHSDYAIWIRDNVSLKIVNSESNGGIIRGVVSNTGKLLEIDAGEYNATSAIHASDEGSTTIINDGKFFGDYPVWGSNGEILINGGTFETPDDGLDDGSNRISVNRAKLTIKGGTFYVGVSGNTLLRENTRIEGGTFYLSEEEDKSMGYLTVVGGSFPDGIVSCYGYIDDIIADGYAVYDGDTLVRAFNKETRVITGENITVKPHKTHTTEIEANCIHGDLCYCGKEISEISDDNHGNLIVYQIKEVATCSSYAIGYAYCDICRKDTFEIPYEEGGYSPSVHSELIDVAAKNPTCSEIGWPDYQYCKGCGFTSIVEIGKVDHYDGNADYICDYGCGHKFERPAEPTPDTPDKPADNCDHLCHKSGFLGFIWKIVQFFTKLFKTNPVCECGAAHY